MHVGFAHLSFETVDISTKHQGLCLFHTFLALQSTEIVLNFLHQSLWQVFAEEPQQTTKQVPGSQSKRVHER